MRVLITGADGMLGSNLARMLLKKGITVVAFIYPGSKSKTLDGLKIEKVYGNILETESLDKAVANSDAVVHAAASTSIWPARSETVRKINIKGTENIINSALKYNIKHLVYIGSASSVNTAETTKGKYTFPGEKFGLDYIDSKYFAFNLVMDAIKNRNLPAVAILPTYMIGAYDSGPGSGEMILKLAQGKLKFYTKGGRNFIYVQDVAQVVINCLKNHITGKYYIAGNENLPYQSFFKKVSSVTGQKEPKIKIPGSVVKFFGYIGDITSKLTGKQPLLSYPMARIACEKQFVSSKEAVKELNMPQTPVEIAIKDCYDWFRSNGYL